MSGLAQRREKLALGHVLRVSKAPGELQDYSWVNQRLAEYDAKALETSEPSGGVTAIVVLSGGNPIAGVTLYEKLGWTIIERLWVEPDFRRVGLASLLINECELRATRCAHYGVRLTTTTGHEALKLYASLGYSVDARWPLRSGSGRQLEELVLSKRIDKL